MPARPWPIFALKGIVHRARLANYDGGARTGGCLGLRDRGGAVAIRYGVVRPRRALRSRCRPQVVQPVNVSDRRCRADARVLRELERGTARQRCAGEAADSPAAEIRASLLSLAVVSSRRAWTPLDNIRMRTTAQDSLTYRRFHDTSTCMYMEDATYSRRGASAPVEDAPAPVVDALPDAAFPRRPRNETAAESRPEGEILFIAANVHLLAAGAG